MYVVTGVSGQTGSAAASALLDQGQPVRVVVRDQTKGEVWSRRGAEVAVADLKDTQALATALEGATGAWILNPPAYRSPDPFAEAQEVANSVREAAGSASLPKLVLLSSVGAHKSERLGMIGTNRILEQTLTQLSIPVTVIRAAFFMDNWIPTLSFAKEQGILPSLNLPLEKARPAVSTLDIGRAAAEALVAASQGHSVVELQGPREYSPNDVAAALSSALGKPVQAVPVPEEKWAEVVGGFGFSPNVVDSYIEMMRSNNSEYFQPENTANVRHGSTTIEQAVSSWLGR